MGKTIQQIPLLPKLIVGVLVLAALGRMISMHERHRENSAVYQPETQSGDAQPARYRPGPAAGGASSRLAQWQAQQRQVQSLMMRCKSEMDQAMQGMAAAAMQGQMPGGQAPCQQSMPLWIAQEAVAETNIYRIQTGNYNATVLEVSGVQVGPQYSSTLVSSTESNSDAALRSVDDWDRGAIREHAIFQDESGNRQELDDHNYYYRNRATGDMVPSESSNPPDRDHDWEQLQQVSHPQ